MDYTIIKTKSGKVFPKNINDWELLYPCVNEKLKELSKTHTIIIFTNQLGVSKEKISSDDLIKKFTSISDFLEIDIVFLASTKDDINRKPRVGLWEYFQKINKVEIDIKKSFYVGDAAGRIQLGKIKKDHGDTDLKFAKNIGLKFYTPEKFFLNEDKREYTYSGYLLDYKKKNKMPTLSKKGKNMVLISGYPGSGKSYLGVSLKDKYDYIFLSGDKLKSKLDKTVEKHMKNDDNIIIEGLMYSNKQRNRYLTLAEKYSYKKIFIEVITSYDLSKHLNYYRFLYNNHSLVSEVVYRTYKKNYEKYEDSDFDQVIKYHPNTTDDINQYFLY